LTQKLVLRSGEHTHSNQLLEQTVRDLEQEKVKLVGKMPTVVPRSVLGDITVALETNLPGGTAFMRSKQSISKAIHRDRLAIKGFPHKPKVFEDILDIPPQLKVTSYGQPFLVLYDTVIMDDLTANQTSVDLHEPTWQRGVVRLHQLVLVCGWDL
jgi:hypothetical protein